MKGLFLKDFLLIKNNMKYFAFMILMFCALSFASVKTTFFSFYSVALASIISTTTFAYDEKDGWNVYSLTMPYTRKELVLEKYLLTLLLVLPVTVITGIGFVLNEENRKYTFMILLSLSAGLILPGVSLPAIFKFGAQKGRMVSIFIAVFISCIGAFMINITKLDTDFVKFSPALLSIIALAFSFTFFVISYLISLKIYSSKEI